MVDAQLEKDILEFFDLLMSLDLNYTKKMINVLQKAVKFREKVDKLSEIEFQRLKAEYILQNELNTSQNHKNDEKQPPPNTTEGTMREIAKREAERLYKKGINEI